MNNTGAMPKKSTCHMFCLNLGQTAEDSDMFTNIWLSSRGLIIYLKLYFLKELYKCCSWYFFGGVINISYTSSIKQLMDFSDITFFTSFCFSLFAGSMAQIPSAL